MSETLLVVAVVCMALTAGAVSAPGAELSGVLIALPAFSVALLLLGLSWEWLVGMWERVAWAIALLVTRRSVRRRQRRDLDALLRRRD